MKTRRTVSSRLFVPERPQHHDGRRGGLPERGVSLQGGIQGISQILVQTAMLPALAADSTDQQARGGGEEQPGVHHGPSGGPGAILSPQPNAVTSHAVFQTRLQIISP